MMELEVGQWLPNNTPNASSMLSLFSPLVIELHEKNETSFRVGDLWIPIDCISPHHKTRFFFPRIEELFVVKNKVEQVKHTWKKFRVLAWTLGKDFEGEWVWNFEHEGKMHYGL